MTQLLYALLKTIIWKDLDDPIIWKDLDDVTFQILKESLIHPHLGHPNYQLLFFLFKYEKKKKKKECP